MMARSGSALTVLVAVMLLAAIAVEAASYKSGDYKGAKTGDSSEGNGGSKFGFKGGKFGSGPFKYGGGKGGDDTGVNDKSSSDFLHGFKDGFKKVDSFPKYGGGKGFYPKYDDHGNGGAGGPKKFYDLGAKFDGGKGDGKNGFDPKAYKTGGD